MGYSTTRKHPRYPVDFRVRLATPSEARIEAESTNISESGVQLVTDRRFERGDTIEASVEVNHGQPPVNATGTVRWCTRNPKGGFRVGVEFENLDAKSESALRTVVDRHLERRRDARKDVRVQLQAWPPRHVPVDEEAEADDGLEVYPSLETWVDAHGRDVSMSGMRIASTAPMEAGERIVIELGFRSGHRLMEAAAVVRWSQPNRRQDGYDVGIEFEEMDAESSDFLRSLVNSL